MPCVAPHEVRLRRGVSRIGCAFHGSAGLFSLFYFILFHLRDVLSNQAHANHHDSTLQLVRYSSGPGPHCMTQPMVRTTLPCLPWLSLPVALHSTSALHGIPTLCCMLQCLRLSAIPVLDWGLCLAKGLACSLCISFSFSLAFNPCTEMGLACNPRQHLVCSNSASVFFMAGSY